MTTNIIILLCSLLLIAYFFDISASKTKIPSVILLLLLGWGLRQVFNTFNIALPNLSPILPILGTIGLILIVLEGSLELEVNAHKMPLLKKSTLVGFFPLLVLSLGLAYVIYLVEGVSFKTALTNAIPLFVISSAIAIPSVRGLPTEEREFIIYESSLSDIFGVIFFNFIALNATIEVGSVWTFIWELGLMLIISLVATIGLALLLSKLKHQVKFVPIILIIVLIYAISKYFHLPSLIFIMILGLFLGNLDELKSNPFIRRLHTDVLDEEVHKFHEITAEFTFVIRVLFFILFGFLIENAELFNSETIFWAIGIVIAIFVVRYLFFKLFKVEINPLVWVAPRGLITVLLFLSIPETEAISTINKSLVIQIIIIAALIMMIGLMQNKKQEVS